MGKIATKEMAGREGELMLSEILSLCESFSAARGKKLNGLAMLRGWEKWQKTAARLPPPGGWELRLGGMSAKQSKGEKA